ncbi:hypothetical protein GOP47_0017989 [Adiantum capillus-veneris]|uniref:Uncharacterized protein n=1 Tax=Adiantum capillus-veneris TaxID=13818 RepID=A0A9D4UGH3_ADICA|nr:hypothetical protein GOP47_0017989 [Adiantum capillus-veneris]
MRCAEAVQDLEEAIGVGSEKSTVRRLLLPAHRTHHPTAVSIRRAAAGTGRPCSARRIMRQHGHCPPLVIHESLIGFRSASQQA